MTGDERTPAGEHVDAAAAEAQRALTALERDADAATVLVVDDRPENVTALETILEPLGVRVLRALSGREALRILLDHDVAVIVLDVRMPVMDGYETAQLIKQRERTRHVPIIFLTAMSADRDSAIEGYEAGGVDFIQKPVEPAMLRAKVSTFVELHDGRVRLARQAELLRHVQLREAERELEAERERAARELRDLADAMPTMVFALNADGTRAYESKLWKQYTGTGLNDELDARVSSTWSVVHPQDAAACAPAWQAAIESPATLPGGKLDQTMRIRRHDGAWRWHQVSAVARYDDHGTLTGWVGTATEIDHRLRSDRGQRVLAEVGALLVRGVDINETLGSVSARVVPAVADWCTLDVALHHQDTPRRLAMSVNSDLDPNVIVRLGELLPPADVEGPASLLLENTGERRLVVDQSGRILDDDNDGTPSAILVPLDVRGERIGVVTIAIAPSTDRELGSPEISFARSLATRVASAVDASISYREAAERAQAAEVLDTIADGVALIDAGGTVLLWNSAAGDITGVTAADIVGRRVGDVLADWPAMAERIDVVARGERGSATTVPMTTRDGREIWMSVSAVGFARGTAFAFRDLTEERAVERMKTDFVATVSHELRTPLASIYGSAITLQREDLDLDESMRSQLLDIIGQQSQQLATIVDAVLTASRLDAGETRVNAVPVDGVAIAREVVDAARTRAHESHQVHLQLPDVEELPRINADPSHLRQVLDNLVENAIKYSPEGGNVTLAVAADPSSLRYEIRDEGLGISPAEQRRIFEKFYRVDADMTGGIGGTGLGLFIVRELVRRMAGRIDVESTPGRGSTFSVTLPVAHAVSQPVGGSAGDDASEDESTS